MAKRRNYKRDQRGRFARTGVAVRNAVAVGAGVAVALQVTHNIKGVRARNANAKMVREGAIARGRSMGFW